MPTRAGAFISNAVIHRETKGSDGWTTVAHDIKWEAIEHALETVRVDTVIGVI